MGGAVMDFRVSPSLREFFDEESSYLKTVAIWTEKGAKLCFEVCSGVGEEKLELDELEGSVEEDVLILRPIDGGEALLKYRRIR